MAATAMAMTAVAIQPSAAWAGVATKWPIWVRRRATTIIAAMMGTGAFSAIGRAPGGMAFGPCLLTTVADYRAAGGHAAVRGEVVEDVHLVSWSQTEVRTIASFPLRGVAHP